MSRKMSLRNQAIIFAIALGTVPVIVTGIITYWMTSPSIKDGVIRYQTARAIGISSRLRQYTEERIKDLNTLSGLGVINDETQRQAVIDRFRESYGVYQNIVVSDLTGKVVLQTQGSSVTNISNEDYFQEVRRTNQVTVEPRSQGGEYGMIFAAPFSNVNTNQFMGVVRTLVPIRSLVDEINIVTEQLTQAGGGDRFEGEEHHVIDDDGQIFLSSNRNALGKNIQEIMPNFRELSQSNQTIVKEMFNPAANEENLIVYIPIPTVPGISELNWGVIVTNDTAEVFAAENNLFNVLIFVVVVTAGAVSVVAALFANGTTKTITEIANVIRESSVEIASTMEQQERITSQQAMAVNQTTSTMNELNNSARQSAEQAEGSAHGARQALSLTEEGSDAVEHTLDGMNVLREKVGAISQQIMRLSQQTNQIGNISTIVADLANQTNMLALNASVEAVRAGEHGKGFGVVASEIRKLADQSKNSAEKINTLVADIQTSIDQTVMVTDEGTKTVEEGFKIAQETEKAFAGVSNAIDDIVLSTQQISLNAEQQVTAIQQVVDAMNNLNASAQENVRGITQVKNRTQELSKASRNLQDVV